MKNAKIKNILLLCSAIIATKIMEMLTLIQPPLNWSLLAWVSLVPLILICSPDSKPFPLALAAYSISLCTWLSILYWLAPITKLGWIALAMYTVLLWPILVLCLRYCRMKKIPLFIAVPILFVGAEYLQGLNLGVLSLSYNQYLNITLIQISDIFGASGVLFLVAMVNGLIAELIIAARQKNILKIGNFLKTALVCAALLATIVYGRWRLRESDKFIEAGPLVASLQSNIPQSVKESFQSSETMFDELLQKSKASAEAGAKLIIWPETMVQATLSPKLLKLLDASSRYRIFDKKLKEHSKNTAFVLIGAYAGKPQLRPDLTIHLAKKYNSAFLYQPDGSQADKQYHKIHLVPFGEKIPFRKTWPFLYKLLSKFSMYDYDYSLDNGTEYTVFEMTGADGQNSQIYRFSVMICSENTIPALARNFAMDQQGQKQLDWLINISNDGWFIKFENGKVYPSAELAHHTARSVFRAVENRLAVMQSVNGGISCLIDTVGRVRDGFVAGTLPHQGLARQGMAGWFADRVPIDKRTTFFSKYGQWLDYCCAACLILLIITPLLERFVIVRKDAKN